MSIFFCVVCQTNHDSDEVEMYNFENYDCCYEGYKNKVIEAKGGEN